MVCFPLEPNPTISAEDLLTEKMQHGWDHLESWMKRGWDGGPFG